MIGLCAGCEPSAGTGQERYIPASEKALAAITVALEMWQRGDPAGEVPGTKPLVIVVDSFRRVGQTLEQFEVLGEVPGLTQRTYLVKLKFANPAAEEKARYAVFGIDPLWIYRHEDLELLMHWEHKMPAPSTEKQP
ncbi:MAG: hypothetical protein ACKV2Q_20675 [Planctomycetaceae bacterium]